ncbi:ABC transporter permease subunit [Dactylosporangium aurantiacum]|uniref:ABC transporter permease subunit n=1 Tax=Dactylosporangium aurantiacum TaxID=35754 RepID=A0A9Q9MDD1_9ACTN|nr:ABC transporter permease subunit [Dactylosporangium aurantiacum]MDG6103551.1 ABC transporter permease subunit [Dactylosporangium aurantiacum]UWZ51954.1 ABC transporter permease subunit [Dactylosporangium aurantiacum]
MKGYARLVHAEWTKFRTIRGWMVGLVAAAVVIVGFGLFPGMEGTCGTRGAGSECALPVGPEGQEVSDTFTFVHRPLAGDGTITVRVASMTGTRPDLSGKEGEIEEVVPWAKAGLIVKDGTRRGSTYAAVMLTGGHGVRLQHDYVHDRAGSAATAAGPRWLRLTRAGDRVTALESADGTSWNGIGTVRLTGLPATAEVGLFVASPQFTEATGAASAAGGPSRATAEFDQLTTAGGWQPGGWTVDQIGADAAPGGSGGPGGPGEPGGPGGPGGAGGPGPGGQSGGERGPGGGRPNGAEQTAGGFTVTGSGDIAPAVAGAAGLGTTISQTLIGTFAGLVLVVVLGAMIMTGEYRRGLIRTSLAAAPRRLTALAAKATVLGTVTFVAGLVAAAVVVTFGPDIMRGNGIYVHPASAATQLRVVVGTGALLAVAAVLALAFGVLLRRGTVAVTLAIVATVLPYLLSMTVLPVAAGAWLLRVTPAAAFAVQQSTLRYPQVDGVYTPANGFFPLEPWAGFGVLLAWAVAGMAFAAYRFQRRDV